MRTTLFQCLSIQAEKQPDKEALIYKDRRITYQQFDQAVDRIASLLLHNGLKKDDRVAVYIEKCPEEAFGLLGASRAGGIFIDVNHMLKPAQVRHILKDSGVRFLLTTCQRLNLLAAILGECNDLEAIVVFGSGEAVNKVPVPVVEYDRCENVDAVKLPRVVEIDIGAIIYTSGSTGMPKGVVLSHRNLVAGAESVSTYVENRADDRILSVLPFSFDYGLNQLTTSIYAGATCVLINYLFPNDIFKALEKESITGMGLIPPLWLQLLQKDWDRSHFPHWRYMTNTGGRLPESAVREFRKRLPETDIYLMYGLTEAFRGTYLPPDEVDRRPDSVGRAIPNAEIWVLNEKGAHCKPGEEGELVQRGAHVSLGYWNDPEKTAKSFRPNPFAPDSAQFTEYIVYSGDRFKRDEEGFLYFVSRADEMIKTSGYRVSPSEIEEALYATEMVEHAVAFGVPDAILGEIVVAVVSILNGSNATPRDLQYACGERLAGYMIPKQIQVWESLPLNTNGKLDRPAIKQKYMATDQN